MKTHTHVLEFFAQRRRKIICRGSAGIRTGSQISNKWFEKLHDSSENRKHFLRLHFISRESVEGFVCLEQKCCLNELPGQPYCFVLKFWYILCLLAVVQISDRSRYSKPAFRFMKRLLDRKFLPQCIGSESSVQSNRKRCETSTSFYR